jgi:hypothetical protein
MAFKVFTPGVLTASDVNTFLMRQAVIVCTSTTRPASPNEGMTIYETNTKRYMLYNGTAWVNAITNTFTTFTPTIDAGITLGNGTLTGRWSRVNRWVLVQFQFVFGSTSAITGTPTINLPFSASGFHTGNEEVLGNAEAIDVSDGRFYQLRVQVEGTTLFAFAATRQDLSYVQQSGITSTIPMTWATDDRLRATFLYPAASDA